MENHRIFFGLSPTLFVYYPPSFYTLFCFLLVPLFCIYIGVSILCNIVISIKKSIIFFSHFSWYQSHGRFELGLFRVFYLVGLTWLEGATNAAGPYLKKYFWLHWCSGQVKVMN